MRVFYRLTFIGLLALVLLTGVSADERDRTTIALFEGRWYARLQAPAGEFGFELQLSQAGGQFSGVVEDGHHRTTLQDFQLQAGKLTFGIDDARVRFELERSGDQLVGHWIRKGSTTAQLKITATRTPVNPPKATRAAEDFVGEWYCVTKDEAGKESPVSLIIRAQGSNIEGTGIDPTGDFGAMRGQIWGDRLVLSRFDGQSLSLVVATLSGGQISAAVSTSPLSQYSITGARRAAAVVLPDPGNVAKVKSGINFAFPDINGNKISFPGTEFKGKVVIVNIMGTWCHNCHDETPFLIELYNKYHSRGLEIVSLCFEAQLSEADDLRAIERYQRTRKIPYKLLYAGKVGENGPAKQITGMEQFGGYPTNIFISRDGQIDSTHTGFWGPATGEKYTTVKRRFEDIVEKLLSKN
ncbi:MAG: TlpA disulfide reductase family protein [Acidobacteriota bacterium]